MIARSIQCDACGHQSRKRKLPVRQLRRELARRGWLRVKGLYGFHLDICGTCAAQALTGADWRRMGVAA